MIKKSHETFLAGSCESVHHIQTPTIDRVAAINYYVQTPTQSLRRGATCLDISVSAVRFARKNAGMKCYHPKPVYQLHPTDIAKTREICRKIHDKIKVSLNFVKLVLFSDEAVFHFDGGVNVHNVSHWSMNNPNWLIEKS